MDILDSLTGFLAQAENFAPPTYFEYLAVFLWATSGAIVGWRKGYDNIGVFVVAVVSAFGGGILRDGIFLNRMPPLVTVPAYFPIIALATTIVIFVGRRIQQDRVLPKIVSVIDAAGVPMFAVVGAELALAAGLPPLSVLFLATVSGVGGGLLRDLMVGDTPELLRPGQYNTLFVVMVAALYVLLIRYAGLQEWFAAWISIALFFIARMLTIRFNWQTRPVNEFEVNRVVGVALERIPIRRGKAKEGRQIE
jgi:uncharacterized membrane protein YeiH